MTDPSSNTDFMAGYSGITRPNVAGSGLPHRSVLNSPPPPGRLTSLRSRDLTLGGFKKKTFVPNVHSLRKSKDELKEEAHVAPKKDRRVREERHRERRERPPQIIQSHSIFEQGPADTVNKPGGWRGTDLTDSRSSPVAKCFKKERRASEENDMLHKLQRDDFLDDPGLKNDAKNKPIQLPLYQSSNFLITEATTSFRAPATTNPNLPLQYGPGHQYGPGQIPQYRPDQGVLSPDQIPQYRPDQGVLSPDQPSVAELFHQLMVSETEELLFIQLPDTIPGQPTTASVPSQPATATGQPITAPERNCKKDSKSDGKRTSHIKAPDTAGKDVPVLSEFTEGFLGKLQIRKSGKVQLVLGDITMDVSEGAAFSFLQQLVSVRLSEGLTGDMSILGNVKHKLVCSPDFQALLQEPSPDHSAHL
ncbi:DNA-directed RNA polymerase III subunit RPC4-like [Oncorhynchus keta]|uniref:DNA-directed RNA polymerase III subunit RPC4-like n=1 Tax=Oncorhynchus keta TaxID=8018 RepID=UPI00227C869B|nr:DNA-directed RNA polymerase III subunit RPC4-like [Oncorhynchus keta]